MPDVLRDLRARVSVDSASVGPGLAAIRSQVNATTRELDALATASLAPVLGGSISSQVAKWSAADQTAFGNMRNTAALVQAQILTSSDALQAALETKDLVGVRKADKDLTTLRRVLDQSTGEIRGLFVKNIDLAPLAGGEGEKAGATLGRGVERGLVRSLGRGLGLGRLPLGSAGLFAGFVAVSEISQQFQVASAATQKLIADLGVLRTASGLGVDGTARLAAEAEAAGVDVGSLAAAVKAARSSGQTFDQVRDEISAIEDPTLRAAAAQRILGDAARGVVPLFTAEGAAAKATADEVARLVRLQQSGQLGKALQAQSTPILGGVAEFFNDVGTRLNLALQRTAVRLAADQRVAREHPDLLPNSPVLGALQNAAADEAEAALNRQLSARIEGTNAIEEAAARQGELTAAETAGTKSLGDMAKNADDMTRALSGTDIATDKLGAALQRLPVALDVASAFDLLKSAGALGAGTEQALSISVRLNALGVDVNSAQVLRTFENLGDLSGTTMGDHARAALEKQLVDLDVTTNVDPLKAALADRVSITQRIADLEANIADRAAAASRLSFDFSKAELDEKLRAREDEKAFFAFRDKAKSDTSRQDAADARELATLRAQLADSFTAHPALEKELADAQAALAALKASLAPATPQDAATADARESAKFRAVEKLFAAGGEGGLTLTHRIQFGTDGRIVVLSADEASRSDLVVKMFGPTIGDLIVAAITGAQTVVDNTRPAATVAVGGGSRGGLR